MRREAAVGERAGSRLAALQEPARLRGLQPGLTVLGSAGAAGKATAVTASNDDLVSPLVGDVAGPCRAQWMMMVELFLLWTEEVVVVLYLSGC